MTVPRQNISPSQPLPVVASAIDAIPAKETASMRLERIDVLRAIAALTVVAYHLLGAKLAWHWPWQDNGFPDTSGLGWKAAPIAVLAVGWAGVPLFFALSGFCIHTGFLRHPHFDLGSFFWRRFWRIYPPFLAAVALFCFWPVSHLGTDFGATGLLGNLSMAFTLLPETFWSPLNPSFWSVGVEVQCYLLYPIFLFLRARFGASRVALSWFAIGVIGRVIAGALEAWPDHPIGFWYCFPVFSFGDWALGALVAEDIAAKRERAIYKPAFLLTAVVACVLSTLWRPALSVSFALAAATGALLIKIYAARATDVNRTEGVLSRIGLFSYSLYLWHQPLLGPLETLGRNLSSVLPLNAARVTTYIVILGGLLAIGALSYRLLEKPGMAMASRFRKSKRPSS